MIASTSARAAGPRSASRPSVAASAALSRRQAGLGLLSAGAAALLMGNDKAEAVSCSLLSLARAPLSQS